MIDDLVNTDDANADYYTVLGLKPTATREQIRKRFLRLTRVSHPDKAPLTSEAFVLLRQAYSVIGLEDSVRAAYDQFNEEKTEAARKRRQIEAEMANGARRLAQTESAIAEFIGDDVRTIIETERKRLRETGQRLLDIERQNVERQIAAAKQERRIMYRNTMLNRILVRWETVSQTATASRMEQFNESHDLKTLPNGGYTESILRRCLEKYGKIVAMVMCTNRPGCAIVEFATRKSAEDAINNEVCQPDNPIVTDWYRDVKQMRYPLGSAAMIAAPIRNVIATRNEQIRQRQRVAEQFALSVRA
uniref:Baculovirus J domain protein n=1 Tax=Spodoptera litura multicapsid nucleopolyhedrovirus TaxID=46242 RepID=B0LUL4_NPVST|nr:baculovirus J domain protein [Spodoptera litura nucleopolyhedrovirus]